MTLSSFSLYKLSFLSVAMAIMFSCNRSGGSLSAIDPNIPHTFVAVEVVQAPSYTYVLAREDGNNFWIATSKAAIVEGQDYSFTGAMEMLNFTSEELDRTFEKIYFVNELKVGSTPPPHSMSQGAEHGRQGMPDKVETSVKPPNGGVTIAELYENREAFESKKVKVRGEVVKFSPNIMNRNWVHIQDGTGEIGSHDLTITTDADIGVGEIGTFEGIIRLRKDFGSGYYYEIIMEDAALLSRKTKL